MGPEWTNENRYLTEDACRNIIVVALADEPHDCVGTAVNGKACQQMLVARVTFNSEPNIELLKDTSNKIECVEFLLVSFLYVLSAFINFVLYGSLNKKSNPTGNCLVNQQKFFQ